MVWLEFRRVLFRSESTRLNCSHTIISYDWSSDVCSRSEEHTSELQSHDNLVCRLLLEKNNYNKLYVVEGFFEFLSLHQLKTKTQAFGADADFLTLNTLSFLKRSYGIINDRESFLFLDNDQA